LFDQGVHNTSDLLISCLLQLLIGAAAGASAVSVSSCASSGTYTGALEAAPLRQRLAVMLSKQLLHPLVTSQLRS